MIKHDPKEDHTPNYEQLKDNFEAVRKRMREGKIIAASAVKFGGIGYAIAKMALEINSVLPLKAMKICTALTLDR